MGPRAEVGPPRGDSTCAGRSPPSVLGGIQLSGLPWSPAGPSSTTFGLAPHGSAVSSRSPPTSRSPHHRPRWAGSRFCSGADPLGSRLSAPCVLLRGRNFPRRSPWPVHRLASAPRPGHRQLTISYRSKRWGKYSLSAWRTLPSDLAFLYASSGSLFRVSKLGPHL